MYAGMCGSMEEETLSLVFICDRMWPFMESRKIWFADGSERKKMTKPKNAQMFSIYCRYGNRVILTFRAIMLRKTKEAYLELFDYVLHLMPNSDPAIIMGDYEEGLVLAMIEKFPNAEWCGCLYHYDVAMLRHCKVKLHLQALITQEEAVSSIIRAACALPLLRPEDIAGGLEDLGQEAQQKGWMEELRPFIYYMEDEWISKAQELSVYGIAHRTNNVAESGNRALNKTINLSRPGCYRVVKSFVTLNDRALIDIGSVTAGLRAARERKISVLRNDKMVKRLQNLLENDDITRLAFLHAASYRMQNVFNKVIYNLK